MGKYSLGKQLLNAPFSEQEEREWRDAKIRFTGIALAVAGSLCAIVSWGNKDKLEDSLTVAHISEPLEIEANNILNYQLNTDYKGFSNITGITKSLQEADNMRVYVRDSNVLNSKTKQEIIKADGWNYVFVTLNPEEFRNAVIKIREYKHPKENK